MPPIYTKMLLANYMDFEGGGLYDPPYQDFDYFVTRAANLARLFGPPPKTVTVWGCGWGYLIKHLNEDFGYSAVGVDASTYAVDKAQEIIPGLVTLWDVTKGPVPVTDFNVTEDMLTCLTDDEIQRAVPNLHITASVTYHIISSPDDGGIDHDPRINWKTREDWQTFLAPDVVLNSHGEVVE